MIKKRLLDHTHIDASIQSSILNISGLIASPNDKVNTVLNLGYYNHRFVQGADANRPIYVVNDNIPSLSFPGLNWISSTNTGGLKGSSNIISTVVARTIGTQSSSQYIYKVCSYYSLGQNMLAHTIGAATPTIPAIDCVNRRYYGDTYLSVSAVPITTTPFVQTLASNYQTKTLDHYVNGELKSQSIYPSAGLFDPGNNTNPNHVSIGAQDIAGGQPKCLFGNVYEIIVSTYYMTPSQIIDRQLYLMDKWGI